MTMKTPTDEPNAAKLLCTQPGKGCNIRKLSQHQLETTRAILQVLFW